MHRACSVVLVPGCFECMYVRMHPVCFVCILVALTVDVYVSMYVCMSVCMYSFAWWGNHCWGAGTDLSITLAYNAFHAWIYSMLPATAYFSRPFLAKDASGEKIAPILVPPYALQMTWLPLHSYGLQLSLPTFEAAQRQRDSKKSVLYPVVASNLPYICIPIPQFALQMEWLRLLLPTQ